MITYETHLTRFAKDSAIPVLEPYMESLKKAVLEGHKQYYSNNTNQNLAVFENRTKSGCIRDYVVNSVKEEFSHGDPVKMFNVRGLFVVCIGEYAIRFKKVDKHLRASNIKTKQNRAYTNQTCIPGFPKEFIHVDLGYIQDNARNVDSMHLICRYGEQILWSYDLSSGSNFETLDIFAKPNNPIVPKVRVTVKQAERDNQQSGN